VLHMLLWTPSAAALAAVAGPSCIRMGMEGARAAVTGKPCGADRDGAVRDTERARDTEWHGTRCGRGARSSVGPHMKQTQVCGVGGWTLAPVRTSGR
jgi:hypothetical protein